MPDITELVPTSDPGIDIVRPGPTRPHGRCVLLWVQRAKRAEANPAANRAIAIADRVRLPVVAAFCLVPAYPRATLRTYLFLAEGLRDLPEAFAARGIGWVLRIGDPGEAIPALVAALDPALVVTDQDPLRLGRRWRQQVAANIEVPLIAVATDTVAPPALFPTQEHAAYTFRPKLWRAIERHDLLALIPDPVASVRGGLASLRDGPDPVAALDALRLDRSVGRSPTLRGGRREALDRLRRFVGERLVSYHTDRDRPEREGQSGLGPYLHFGQIGPLEVARAVIDAKERLDPAAVPATATQRTTHGADAGAPHPGPGAFLDELITQRELAVIFALRHPSYDDYDALPDWGRRTLAEHASDPRPALYPRDRLEAGETSDRLWNAAQRQMVVEGSMPNRLRMYWAKQILLWTPSPEEAYDVAMTFNDRYFLCGRDPAGYANVAWAIGGRHDRPFPPNKPVLGLVRPLGLKGMRRKFDTDAYVALVEERTGRPIGPAPASTARQGTLRLP